MDANPTTPCTFGATHFGHADLGDQRRTKRLVQLAEEVTGHPGGTLPTKLRHPKDLKAFYRLMNTPQVTHAAVLAPHQAETRQRMMAHPGVVLVIHDTTTLDYSTLTSLHPVLGQVGDGHGHGYLCHNTLAVAADSKEVLGLANQILFHRPDVPKDETKAQRQQRESRESRLWVQGSVAVERPPAGALWIEVSDRGSDTTEYLDFLLDRQRHFVIRSQHNRCVTVAVDGEEREAKLHDWLRTLPAQGRRTIALSERPERPARSATVAVAWTRVTIQPPRQPRGAVRGVPLTVWALRVWESDPPAGAEAVEWFLLTDLPVGGLAAAWQDVDWYCDRWIVEEYHKGMKTGCDVEALQFTTEQALQPAIAFLSVVTLWLLWLRTESRRPEAAHTPATELFPAEYVEVLSLDRYREVRPLSIREFCQLLGRLGGHQNRKHDRPPGWLVLWRGWTKLALMVQGARAFAQKKCGQT